MVLIAILCPGLSFLLRGKIFSAILAIILQAVAFCTFILFGLGFYVWLVTATWAVISYNQGKADRRNRALIKAMREGRR